MASSQRRGEERKHGSPSKHPEQRRRTDATRLLELDVTTGHRPGVAVVPFPRCWRPAATRTTRWLRPHPRQPQHPAAAAAAASARPTQAAGEARAIVDDVIDFALTSDEWEGNFGFVTLRLHKGAVDGNDVYFIRTDAADVDFAREQGLVYVPKLKVLAEDGLAGTAVLFDDEEQPVVLSSEPGRKDYTPAWRVQRASWVEDPRPLGSLAEVEQAEQEGALTLEKTDIVINAALVKWSDGELAADTEERTQYLGPRTAARAAGHREDGGDVQAEPVLPRQPLHHH